LLNAEKQNLGAI